MYVYIYIYIYTYIYIYKVQISDPLVAIRRSILPFCRSL